MRASSVPGTGLHKGYLTGNRTEKKAPAFMELLFHEISKVHKNTCRGCTSPLVQWLQFHLPVRGGWSSVRGWGIKTPHASGPKPQTIKQKQYCNKVNKDFKNCLHQRILKNKKNICGGTSNEEWPLEEMMLRAKSFLPGVAKGNRIISKHEGL